MDWRPYFHVFLQKDDFDCVGSSINQSCTVIQVYDSDVSQRPQKIELRNQQDWDEWFTDLSDLNLFSADEYIEPSCLPRGGLCILFIPRAAGIKLPETSETVESNLTDLPINEENWQKISKAFWLLPGHIVKAIGRKLTSTTSIVRTVEEFDGTEDLLWMNTAMTNPTNPDAFALASTHIVCAQFSLALMIGCSDKQIERVRQLVENAEDAISHPLLMLGLCAELHLDRLRDLVTRCSETAWALGDSNRSEIVKNSRVNGSKKEVTGDLIKRVRECRVDNKIAEEEVRTVKRHLIKALPPAARSFVNGGENLNGINGYSNKKNGSARSSSNATTTSGDETEVDDVDQITIVYFERFAEIFAKFDDLIADCQISVEEMSSTADIIMSDLARQEAKSSTVIAFVAMLYLPMTTIATIFAMPIFQYSNDWRDWRYHQVGKGNSTGLEGPTTATATSAGLPVFSGYLWIYFAVSTAFTLVTIEGWWRFTSRGVERRKGRHWSRYLMQMTWIHIKDRVKKLCLLCCCGSLNEPTQHQQQAQSEERQSDTGSKPEEQSPRPKLGTSLKNSSSSSSKPLPRKSPPTAFPKTSLPSSPASNKPLNPTSPTLQKTSSPTSPTPPAQPLDPSKVQSSLSPPTSHTTNQPDSLEPVILFSSHSQAPTPVRGRSNNYNQNISPVSSEGDTTVSRSHSPGHPPSPGRMV